MPLSTTANIARSFKKDSRKRLDNINTNEEISVTIENMMRDGLFILFLNHRLAYALFDKFENMTKPIPVYD